MATSRRIVFTGGGTAGHLLPALAVAEALVKAGHDRSEIEFVGSRRGMGASLVADAGFSQRLLPGRGIVRRFSGQNVLALFEIGLAYVRCLAHLLRVRPSVVVCFGGYAALACSLAASTLRIPLIVMNVDVHAGATNRLVSRFARASAVAAPSAQLARQRVTGVPLRESVLALEHASGEDRARARRELGVAPDAALVVITGGSLGAWRLNQAALGLAQAVAARSARTNDATEPSIVIYHVTGARDYARVRQLADSLGLHPQDDGDYRVVSFEERLPLCYVAADLVIARAGAMTVAELGAIGTPSVLVPLPGAPGDHQRKNAETLANGGGALIVDDADAKPELLSEIVLGLLADRRRLESMARAAACVGERDGTAKVCALIGEVIVDERANKPVMA
jgi:UDP-N-acetylglucosamine--N-acetylmuramyl-(pentapeptide) pyrophosphoryl-undecaprenol N-acetylglucosamine transferase